VGLAWFRDRDAVISAFYPARRWMRRRSSGGCSGALALARSLLSSPSGDPPPVA
jgi:hypothetical protein